MSTTPITVTLMPDGFAKGSDGKLYRRMKWDGPNYDYRTPVQHGVKNWIYDLYEIDPARPNQPKPGRPHISGNTLSEAQGERP